LTKIIKEELKNFDDEVYDTEFTLHITDDNVNKDSSLEIITKKQGFEIDENNSYGIVKMIKNF